MPTLSHGKADADNPDERIQALISSGKSAEAIPLVRERAQSAPDARERWELLLKLAGWNSDAEAALEALRNLVRLDPENRELRLSFAQRLLWAKRTGEARPHAKWLLRDSETRDPVSLEVATWVLLGEGDREAARQAVQRWIDADPGATSPRWVLADLSHWSVRWRDAEEQYDHLSEDQEYGPKTVERRRMLAKDHPTSAEVVFTYWQDTTDVEYLSVAQRSRAPLPKRIVLSAEAELGRWSQGVGAEQARVRTGRGLVGLRFEMIDELQPQLLVGVEGDSEDNVAPVVVARGHLSLWGKLFGRIEGGWDRYRLGLVAAREDVRVTYVRALGYFEPHPWVFVGLDASASRLSDDNARYYGVAALGAHNPGAFQVEPRVFAQIEEWASFRDGANPYFTTRDPLAMGADVTLRFTEVDAWMKAEATAGFVHQGGLWAFTPRGSVAFDVADHLIGKVTAGYVGAVAYRQARVDASLGYRF